MKSFSRKESRFLLLSCIEYWLPIFNNLNWKEYVKARQTGCVFECSVPWQPRRGFKSFSLLRISPTVNASLFVWFECCSLPPKWCCMASEVKWIHNSLADQTNKNSTDGHKDWIRVTFQAMWFAPVMMILWRHSSGFFTPEGSVS